MSQQVLKLKPLFLSEDEAMALLNLCLTSNMETDAAKDRAMLKLTELVRRYIATEAGCAEAKAAVGEISPKTASAAEVPESGAGASSTDAAKTTVPNADRLPCKRPRGDVQDILSLVS
jgi:hypothetical protein